MDILSFIRSKDVVEHLKKIDYKFDAMTAAAVVYQSDKTIAEKQAAYKEIISTFPDCDYEDFDGKHSLFEVLSEHVAKQNKLIDMFNLKEQNTYYHAYIEVVDENDDSDWRHDFNKQYTDLDKWFAAIDKYKDNIKYISIDKIYLNSDKSISVIISANREISRIYKFGSTENELNDYRTDLYFDVNIPVPFKKGDIIKDVGPYWEKYDDYYVVDFMKDDIVIVNVDGLSACAKERLVNMEYRTEKLFNYNRMLYAISAYFKKKIDLYELLRFHELYLTEREYCDKMQWGDGERKLLKLKKRK